MWKRTSDGWDRIRNLCQMMNKTTVDGRNQWRTTHTRWCPDSDYGRDRWWHPYEMMHETTADRWDPWRTTRTEDEKKNYWWMRQNKASIPDDVRNNRWWIRPTRDHAYQVMYNITVSGRDRSRIHEKWWTKQLLMDETNEGIPMPDDVQSNCWWTIQMMESIPDDARNNCWWMRPIKE